MVYNVPRICMLTRNSVCVKCMLAPQVWILMHAGHASIYQYKSVWPPLQVAINWCIAQGTVPIPGAKSLRNAQDNINALSWSLSAAEVDELSAVADKCPRGMVQNIFQTN